MAEIPPNVLELNKGWHFRLLSYSERREQWYYLIYRDAPADIVVRGMIAVPYGFSERTPQTFEYSGHHEDGIRLLKLYGFTEVK